MKLESFYLDNGLGLKMRVINLGGIVTHLYAPDRTGESANIVLGFERDEDYLGEHPYFGALIGRVANRIAQGRFSLGEKSYELERNFQGHHLHGGKLGLHKVLWEVKQKSSKHLELMTKSPGGSEGYPGELEVKVSYQLNENEWRIDYEATTNEVTPVNLTQHSYFNLLGDPRTSVLGHELQIVADSFCEVDQELIPTGRLISVDGRWDFRHRRVINEGGYDLNYVLRGSLGELKKAAELFEPQSGRLMQVFTTAPGLQFYSGNFLSPPYVGLCLEAQHFPDSVHHPQFPSIILHPGEVYRQTTIYRFSTA